METDHNSNDSAQHEIIRLKQVEQELKNRLRQHSAIARLGQQALLGTDLDAVLDGIVVVTAETLDVEYCKVLELLPGGQELLLRAGVGWQEGLVRQAVVNAGVESQAGYTLHSNEPVIVPDLHTETRFTGAPLLHNHGVISGMSILIPGKTGPYGVLGVHTRRRVDFSPDDANFLHSVANIIASAVERFRNEEDLRLSRDQLAIILHGVADGITVQDPAGRLIYANHTAAEVIGYPSEAELLSTPITQVMSRFEVLDEDGNILPATRLPGRIAIQEKRPYSLTVRFRILDTGEERWSIVKATPVLNSAGQVEMAVNIFQDITELKRGENSQRFLAETGELLSASLDYETTLANLTQLAVTQLADWCSVHVVEEDGVPRQLAVAHVDPQKVELARKLQSSYPPDWDAPTGLPNVLRTGQAEFYPNISSEMLEQRARDEEHLRLIRALGFKSAIILPLSARGRVLGALTLVWAESGRRYSQNDVLLAKELARRAATAIDNAWLYQQAQELNSELEARVNRRTDQLQALVNKLHREVSERQKVEQALRQNELLLHGLFESAPDATVLVDQDGKIVQANAQMEAIFGYPKIDLVGRTVDELLPIRYRISHTGQRAIFFGNLRTRPMGAGLDLYGQRKDGSEFPIDIMLSPVQIQQETLVIAAIRDITERKQMESDLQEVQRRLIESVEAERLRLAQELHDGPMQDLYAVIYQLKSMESEMEPDETRVFIQETVQQVIETLRATCGELRPPALAPFGLQKAIMAHLETVQVAHPEIQIETNLMPDGQVLNERVRLALFRIYQHAVSNVVRHSGARRLDIHFSYTEEHIQLRIEDDGCGFELPSRWVEMARGGHLGLVGTAERVKAIGGQLKIISAPGKGTRIEITAPVHSKQNDGAILGKPNSISTA